MTPIEATSPKKGFNYTALILAVVLILGLTLPFHYVPGELTMFPKDNLTMKNTFIFESDVDSIVAHYNNASLSEKEQLREDPFIKKLFEKGLIFDKRDTSKNGR